MSQRLKPLAMFTSKINMAFTNLHELILRLTIKKFVQIREIRVLNLFSKTKL